MRAEDAAKWYKAREIKKKGNAVEAKNSDGTFRDVPAGKLVYHRGKGRFAVYSGTSLDEATKKKWRGKKTSAPRPDHSEAGHGQTGTLRTPGKTRTLAKAKKQRTLRTPGKKPAARKPSVAKSGKKSTSKTSKARKASK
jgi:hypothetical protein